MAHNKPVIKSVLPGKKSLGQFFDRQSILAYSSVISSGYHISEGRSVSDPQSIRSLKIILTHLASLYRAWKNDCNPRT